MTTTPHDLRPGDRITILPGRALSTDTRQPLARRCHLDVVHVLVLDDGTIEVGGIELTGRGVWRKGSPYRSVHMVADAYLRPVREGDTVDCGEPDRLATVTAIHPTQDDGTVTADLLFADGLTSCGNNLARLTHISRAAGRPAPTINPADQRAEPTGTAADRPRRHIPSAGWDHRNVCVGCGAGPFARCAPTCRLTACTPTVADLLRATAFQLPGCGAGNGYGIFGALCYTADRLVGPDRSVVLCNEAMDALATFLIWQGHQGRDGLVFWHGVSNTLSTVAGTLYATAARLDGIPFDLDAFTAFWN